MKLDVEWKGGMTFQAGAPSGAPFTMDSHPDHGGSGLGPTPMEALLGSLAACMAMDVLAILEKKRQRVTAYRVEAKGARPPEGEFPRGFTSIEIDHYVSGENLDPAAVARAVELSESKYCSVMATLRGAPKITSRYTVTQTAQPPG
jgi:putative redox protein